jgi:hypothetical protein
MEFEEFFENKRKYPGHYTGRRDHDDHDFSYESHHSYPGHNSQQKWLTILEKIRSNKKLKIIAGLAVILIIGIAVLLIIVFLPFFVKLFNYISQNGLQGVFDAITGFLDKILKGSAK